MKKIVLAVIAALLLPLVPALMSQAVSEECTPTNICDGELGWDGNATLTDYVDGTYESPLDSAGCDRFNCAAPNDGIDVKGRNLHVDSIGAGAHNCAVQGCVGHWTYYIARLWTKKLGGGYTIQTLRQSQNQYWIPANDEVYGMYWNNGGNGWDFKDGSRICAGGIYWSSGNWHWMKGGIFDTDGSHGACVWIHG